MKTVTVYPDYYENFKCRAGICKHNCCIGWEIEIDDDTHRFYRTVTGEMGERLKNCIDTSDVPHFILGENDRCPFLNSQNLCDIITHLGSQHLCGICDLHPRFKNELPDRLEIGLGLSCEAAAELILGQKEPVNLIADGKLTNEDEIINLRDSVIDLLQNRHKPIDARVTEMLTLCGGKSFEFSQYYAEFLLSLERLDEKWTAVLTQVKSDLASVELTEFDKYMSGRQTEFEQLTVYAVYRHFANAPTLAHTLPRAAFAAFMYKTVRAVGAVIWKSTGEFSFLQLCDTARMFSAEIEYSDRNLYTLLDELTFLS